MERILHYFPDLTAEQKEQLGALDALYHEWNAKINVISRKDIDNLYLHHVLHSLGIAEVIQFKDGTHIMDLGTGGGFPGIPLAIMFPECHFHLVDSIGKKIKVVSDVVDRLGLSNAKALQTRAEQLDGEYDFIVSRAVSTLGEFVPWVKNKVSKSQYHPLHNGILYLKGGDLTKELFPFRHKVKTWDISDFFEEEYFETKKVVYLPL